MSSKLEGLDELRQLLQHSNSPVWRPLRQAQAALEDLAAAVARGGDVAQASVETANPSRGEQAILLLREIHKASADRRPHDGRRLRKAQWDKLVAFLTSANEAEASPAKATVVPRGWRLVPVRPTDAMIEAGEACYERFYMGTYVSDPLTMWTAMLKAAKRSTPNARQNRT